MLGVTAVGWAAGCGSEVKIPSTGAGGDDSTTSATTTSTGVGAGQPPPPGGGGPGDGPGAVFAMSRLYLGDTDRNGAPNPLNGWKQYGYDLDGKVSTKNSTDLCKPNAGGNLNMSYPDGLDGIDNAFGKSILPIYLGLAPDVSSQLNESIAQGAYTVLLDVQTLGPQSSYSSLLGKQYGGANLGGPPSFDGSDVWPVRPEYLVDASDIGSAKAQFPQSYLTGDVWVSGPPTAEVVVELPVGGYRMKHRIHHAIVTMQLTPDHTAATNGTIAGVFDTEELIADMADVAGAIDLGLCSGSTFQSLANQIRQGSDIMKDGTQNPAAYCDGMSVGFGFDAEGVHLGAVGSPEPPPPDPCAG